MEWVRECSPPVLEGAIERTVPSRESTDRAGNGLVSPLSFRVTPLEYVDNGREGNEAPGSYLSLGDDSPDVGE